MAVFLLNVCVSDPWSQCGASGSRSPVLGGLVGVVLSVRGCWPCVLVSRDLAAVWELKNSNRAIKWQDGACCRIKSGFMIFGLHLVFMWAELC